MRGPNENDRKRMYWMKHPEWFVFRKDLPVMFKAGIPDRVRESFELFAGHSCDTAPEGMESDPLPFI